MHEFYLKVLLPQLDISKIKVFELYAPQQTAVPNVYQLHCHKCSSASTATYVKGSGVVTCSACHSQSELLDLLGNERSESSKYGILCMACGLPSPQHLKRFFHSSFKEHLSAVSISDKNTLNRFGIPTETRIGVLNNTVAGKDRMPEMSGCFTLPWYASGPLQCSIYSVSEQGLKLKYEPFFHKLSFEPANFKFLKDSKLITVVSDHLLSSILNASGVPSVALGYRSTEFTLRFLKAHAGRYRFIVGEDEEVVAEKIRSLRLIGASISKVSMSMDASKKPLDYTNAVASLVSKNKSVDLSAAESRRNAIAALKMAGSMLENDPTASIEDVSLIIKQNLGVKLRVDF